MAVRLRLVYLSVSLGHSDLSSSTDAAFRYIRLLLADDNSFGVLHGAGVLCCYFEARVEVTSIP